MMMGDATTRDFIYVHDWDLGVFEIADVRA